MPNKRNPFLFCFFVACVLTGSCQEKKVADDLDEKLENAQDKFQDAGKKIRQKFDSLEQEEDVIDFDKFRLDDSLKKQ